MGLNFTLGKEETFEKLYKKMNVNTENLRVHYLSLGKLF